jgi:hypothetical protein
MDHRQVWPTMNVQTLTAAPAASPDQNAHASLAHWDSETRGWALLALNDAGMDPAAWSARISLADWTEVPEQERAGIASAPNAAPEPTPLFAALAEVEMEQGLLQKREVRRVTAAVRAWRLALADEGEPGASNTPYQKGFFLDLGASLKVADTTAKNLVHAADKLEQSLPLVWAHFLRGRVPWRAMQMVHAAIDGLDPEVLPAFDAAAVQKLDEILLPGLPDALRRLAERLQASTADDRHDRANARRRYTIEPGADGMGWLHAFLPMADLLGLDHQVTKQAIAAHGRAGERRGIQTLKADLMRDGLRSFFRTDPVAAESPSESDAGEGDGDDGPLVPGRNGVEPRVAILIPAMTALGHSTAPPILQGYGPIGIKTALKLAGEAKSWVRVLTDPFTGAILNLGRTKYRPTEDMRALIRLLDGGSRGPGRPRGPDEVDFDHDESYWLNHEHGETSTDNLVLLTRSEHVMKTAGATETALLLDRSLVWQTRSGNKYVTRPLDPPEATPVPPALIDEDDCAFWPAPVTPDRAASPSPSSSGSPPAR